MTLWSTPVHAEASDAVEEQLQALLGFERGDKKGSDPDTRGSLDCSG